MGFAKWLRGVGWRIVLTFHQFICKWDCGFSSYFIENEDGEKHAAAWCLTCDKTWTRP